MKAIVTSIGESTTDLCVWSLERQGFKVTLYRDGTTLANKLKRIFTDIDEDFIRVDADVVVNQNIRQLPEQNGLLWYQTLTFDWFKQDVTHGGIQLIKKQALPYIRGHLDEIQPLERPESYLFRLPAFHNPRLCGTFEKICGLHGFKQSDKRRIEETKRRRGQDGYDFELTKRLETL